MTPNLNIVRRLLRRYRDARTGRYVAQDYAEQHPDTTVSETSPRAALHIISTDEQHSDDQGPGGAG